jgi:hypothetical protein
LPQCGDRTRPGLRRGCSSAGTERASFTELQ